MDIIELYREVAAKYGNDAQRRVAIEEMSELTKELCKFERGSDNLPNIYEEIADVWIMLEQLILMFGCEEEVERWKAYKLVRLRDRLLE